jgi:hypothetical protein
MRRVPGHLPERPRMMTRGGIEASMGPEVISTVLIVILIVGAVLIVATNGSRSDGAPTVGPTVEPSTALTGASASPVDPATSSPVLASAPPSLGPGVAPASARPTPTLSPPPTRASWSTTAQLLIEANLRLINEREALRAAVAARPKRSDDLAQLLRSTNPDIQVALGILDRLDDAAVLPTALATGLRASHESALDANLQTLGLPLANVSGYTKGAAKVVARLAPLEWLTHELALDAGLLDPFPDAIDPSVSPAPSSLGVSP